MLKVLPDFYFYMFGMKLLVGFSSVILWQSFNIKSIISLRLIGLVLADVIIIIALIKQKHKCSKASTSSDLCTIFEGLISYYMFSFIVYQI